MTILRSVRSQIRGADYYALVPNTSIPVGASSIRIPAGTASFSPTCSTGKIRIKVVKGATGTNLVNAITGTDGTATVSLYTGDIALTPTGQSEELDWNFITDLNLTSMTVNFFVSTAAATADVEVVYST